MTTWHAPLNERIKMPERLLRDEIQDIGYIDAHVAVATVILMHPHGESFARELIESFEHDIMRGSTNAHPPQEV